MSLFFIALDKKEETQIKETINICTEYCYLIRMNQLKEKIKSVIGLNYYFRIKLKTQKYHVL